MARKIAELEKAGEQKVEPVEPELITIVEGPTPEFRIASDAWAMSVLEGQSPYVAVTCQVRSFNGQILMDRCHRAWSGLRPIRLDFRQRDGLRRQVDIIGAKLEKVEGIDVLNLWMRHPLHTLIGGGDEDVSTSDTSPPHDV